MSPLPGSDEYRGLREQMVRDQLENRDIRDPRVLAAMREVPRHLFVDAQMEASSYGDHALPIGYEQTISQPYMVALMSQILNAPEDGRVLEIGTGSGYQAAVLARLTGHVYTVERISDLAERARRHLRELGLENVSVRTGDGSAGWPEHQPYDGILVAAAAPEPPPSLLQQLRVGGRLLVPSGSRRRQTLEVVERTDRHAFERRREATCAFVPLIGREGWDPEG